MIAWPDPYKTPLVLKDIRVEKTDATIADAMVLGDHLSTFFRCRK